MNVEGKDCRPRRRAADDAVVRRPLDRSARLQHAEARDRDAARRATASISPRRRSTNSSGTSTATGTSSSPRSSSRAPSDGDEAARARHALGARARARGDAAARASVHSVHHRGAVADRSRRSPARRGETISLQPYPEGESSKRGRRRANAQMATAEGAGRRVPRAAQRDGTVAGAARAAASRPATLGRCGLGAFADYLQRWRELSEVEDRRRAAGDRRAGADRRRTTG